MAVSVTMWRSTSSVPALAYSSSATNATTIDTARLTAVDQSQLVNIVDVTGRWREGPWDTRFVFRDNYTWNFLRDGNNRNRMNALYAETRYAPNSFFARLGRQSATSGGVLGRLRDGGGQPGS
mgnify:CR=1 FL=1